MRESGLKIIGDNMLGKMAYFFLLILSKVLSLIPFFIIYRMADFFAFILYRVIGYRKKIVRENIRKSFPEKSISELRKIEKEFYTYFCDYFFESLMLVYLSPERLTKRCVFKNPELLNQFYNNNRSVILISAHYGNFEMALMLPLFVKYKIFAIYKPQTNVGIDKYFIKSRERFGIEAVAMNSIAKRLYKSSQDNIPTLTLTLSDQRPLRAQIKYWTTFLNQDAPIFTGAEKLSVKYNLAVFFYDVTRISRGKYEVEFKLLVENPKETKEFEITEIHTRYLEKIIQNDPPIWFWGHRRWGHKKMD
jgi:KDO2-lipid IV(A) lauroyltransferase